MKMHQTVVTGFNSTVHYSILCLNSIETSTVDTNTKSIIKWSLMLGKGWNNFVHVDLMWS